MRSTFVCFTLTILALAGTACGERIAGPATRLTLSADSARILGLGQDYRIVARVEDADGKVVANPPIEWSTSDPAVLTVSSVGVVRGENIGVAFITARLAGLIAQAKVVVDDPVHMLKPDPRTVTVGKPTQLQVRVLNSQGVDVPDLPLVWDSFSGPGEVSPTGVMLASDAGWLRATVGWQSLRAEFRVLALPDGEIAASEDRQIWIFGTDGTPLRKYRNDPTNPEESPVWSPNGSQMVFRRGNPPDHLHIAGADGSNLKRLTLPQDVGSVVDPYGWSPDGRTIYFAGSPGAGLQIHRIGADRSDLQALTQEPAVDQSPSTLPDGRVVWLRNEGAGGTRFWIMEADGSAQRRWFSPGSGPDADGAPFHATVSPDGTKLAYMWDSVPLQSSRRSLRIWDLTGGTLIQSLLLPRGRSPRWSPDSRFVVVSNEGIVAVMAGEPDGYAWVRPAADGFGNYRPHWRGGR